MKQRWRTFAYGAASCLALDSALAATASGSLAVSATVVAACTVSNATLAFGNYDPVATADKDATTTLAFSCTPGTSYTLGLDAGLNSADLTVTRSMSQAANKLNYQLYRDSGYSSVWGNSAGSWQAGTSATGTINNTLTVYGRIPKNQAVPAGAYSDTVSITITY